jgi:hypothetical protein
MDALVPALASDEYGRMPASFYANSQTVTPRFEPHLEEESAPKGEADAGPVKMRPPLLPRDEYEGVDSDDESDLEDELIGIRDYGVQEGGEEEEEEEDRPQVVGEVEIDMGEEEDEFLEFSRRALGISDEQWGEIIRERKERGGK